MTWYCFRDQHW